MPSMSGSTEAPNLSNSCKTSKFPASAASCKAVLPRVEAAFILTYLALRKYRTKKFQENFKEKNLEIFEVKLCLAFVMILYDSSRGLGQGFGFKCF